MSDALLPPTPAEVRAAFAEFYGTPDAADGTPRPDVVALIGASYFGPLNDNNTLPDLEGPDVGVVHADGSSVTDEEFSTLCTATADELAAADQHRKHHRDALPVVEIDGKRYMPAAIVLGAVLGHLVESDD